MALGEAVRGGWRLAVRAWYGIAHYRLTVVTTVLVLAVALLFTRSENFADGLLRETRARTLEDCEIRSDRTHATRLTFLSIFDLFDQAQAAAGRPPSEGVARMREIVETQLPEVTCPTDRGPIVVPVPVSTP